jgi:hypothetical protein
MNKTKYDLANSSNKTKEFIWDKFFEVNQKIKIIPSTDYLDIPVLFDLFIKISWKNKNKSTMRNGKLALKD